jgi:hypothetical protein
MDSDTQDSGADTVSDFLLQPAWTASNDSCRHVCPSKSYEALERSVTSDSRRRRLRNWLATSWLWLLI